MTPAELAVLSRLRDTRVLFEVAWVRNVLAREAMGLPVHHPRDP
jgi:hypothetical protein